MFLNSPIDHVDPGTRANPAKPNLLHPDVKVQHISPYLGTEVTGVQISELSKEGLDELALFAAERKVLLFRDQDFKDLSPDRQIEITRWVHRLKGFLTDADERELNRHFGPIQKHPTSGNVKGYPEFHVGKCTIDLSINKTLSPRHSQCIVMRSMTDSRSIWAETGSTTPVGTRTFPTRSSRLAPRSSSSWTRSATFWAFCCNGLTSLL